MRDTGLYLVGGEKKSIVARPVAGILRDSLRMTFNGQHAAGGRDVKGRLLSGIRAEGLKGRYLKFPKIYVGVGAAGSTSR